jgi:CubicO group peptidase (beta-lactamase class C family)
VAPRLTDDGLDAFDDVAQQHVERAGTPGVVALVAHGDQVHVTTAGGLSLDGPPIERDSLFRIASVTKPVTAATTLALVGEGLFDLDEPVDGLLPELADRLVLRSIDAALDDVVPATRPITVRDLLTFTFGFGVTMEMFTATRELPIVAAERAARLHSLGPPEPADQPPADEWIAALGAMPLIAQPGERWLYNTGASVLGVLCARAASAPLDDVMSSRVLAPLGMTSTGMWTTETSRLATSYAPRDGALHVWDRPGGRWSQPPPFPDGAAGLLSTVDDLHAFANLLLRGGEPLLDPGLVHQMTSNQLSDEQRASEGGAILRGLGWGFCQAVHTEGRQAGAFGWDGGLGTTWLVDPVRTLVVIVLTQRMFNSPTPPTIHAELRDAAYAALG